MKVNKCSDKQPEDTVSYNEMRAGCVYKHEDRTYDPARWIVIDSTTTLIYENNNLYTSARSVWAGTRFIHTNETVCFELKPA